MRLRVRQTMALQRRDDVVPADAALLTLPEDPAAWVMMAKSEVYPPPPRRPEASADAFLSRLAGMDLTEMPSDEILRFLYDNEAYLLLLKGELDTGSYDIAFDKRLMLMVGKSDSPQGHRLLTEIFLDEDMSDQARFRSLMALKYSESPIDQNLVEEIFSYSADVSDPADQQLAHSAMLALGIVARNQRENSVGSEISDRIAIELTSSTRPDQAAALLTALGNAGDDNNQVLVESYLSHDDALLRKRSAAALGQMSNDQSVTNLSRLLAVEKNPGVQAAALTALGSGKLAPPQLDQVYGFASGAKTAEVRGAAISALVRQSATNTAVKPQLRTLLRTEKNRANLHKILTAIY